MYAVRTFGRHILFYAQVTVAIYVNIMTMATINAILNILTHPSVEWDENIKNNTVKPPVTAVASHKAGDTLNAPTKNRITVIMHITTPMTNGTIILLLN